MVSCVGFNTPWFALLDAPSILIAGLHTNRCSYQGQRKSKLVLLTRLNGQSWAMRNVSMVSQMQSQESLVTNSDAKMSVAVEL